MTVVLFDLPKLIRKTARSGLILSFVTNTLIILLLFCSLGGKVAPKSIMLEEQDQELHVIRPKVSWYKVSDLYSDAANNL